MRPSIDRSQLRLPSSAHNDLSIILINTINNFQTEALFHIKQPPRNVFSWISSLAAVLTLPSASPEALRPSSLATGIGGAHYSNIQESQTNSWGGPTRAEENHSVVIFRLSATKPVWHNQEMHPSERGYTFLQKTQINFPRQWDPQYS